jgi:hypothetical protein
MESVTSSDYIAQLICLMCMVWSFLRLCVQERFAFPCFAVFSITSIASCMVWVFGLWTIWAWFFPLLMLSFAAAAAESAWKMTEKLNRREQIMSHLFSLFAGAAVAELVWVMRPLFARFPPLSFRIAMSLAGFACGCTLSAVMYWWANRSAGVRPIVAQGSMLAAYALTIIVSAVVSGWSESLWHDSVEVSCVLRGLLQVGAVLTLTRSRRFFSVAA